MKKYLILAWFTVWIIISIQINSALTSSIDTDIQEKLDQKQILSLLLEEKVNLKKDISKLNEEKSHKFKETSENLNLELEKSKIEAWLTDIQWNGVIITINSINNKKCDKTCIVSSINTILNLMFIINVDAVSVNNQRITFKTPVTTNNLQEDNSYEIKIIGDSEFIKGAISTTKQLKTLKENIEKEYIELNIQYKSDLIVKSL